MNLKEMQETNGGGALGLLINTVMDALIGKITLYV